MPIISMINIKGGVGKTQCTINIAGEMAKMGCKVLILDNDCQSSLTQILNVNSEYTMYDLYSSSKVYLGDCITQFSDRIYVVPNTIESAILETELYQKRSRETILKKKICDYKYDFDFILIDNSPYLGLTVQNSLCSSDYYIEIIDNSPSALQGLNMVDKTIYNLRAVGLAEDLKLLGILRNRFEKRTLFSKQFIEVTEEELEEKLFKTIIYDSVKYKEAAAMHMTIQNYNKKFAEPYNQLHYEIINRIK